MKRCSITEYEDEVIMEFYNQQTKERVQYKFDDWDEAFEYAKSMILECNGIEPDCRNLIDSIS